MTSMAIAPATHSESEAWPATDTRLELVSRARAASSRTVVRVMIVNHQPIVRYGLWDVISREPDLEVVGEADDGREAVRLARQLRPDVVLIDLSMPTVDGIAATRLIHADLPDTRVVVMAGVDAHATAIEAIRAGAAAYLLRDSQIDDLLRTIRGAGTGQVALPAQTAARMIRMMSGQEVLSQREIEVLHLVARGLANKQVARKLGITESTVKTHVGSLMSKLELESRTQLALYAARTGLVALDQPDLAQLTGDERPELVGVRVASQPSTRPFRFAAWPTATQA